jgi:hypothetical protein
VGRFLTGTPIIAPTNTTKLPQGPGHNQGFVNLNSLISIFLLVSFCFFTLYAKIY